MEYHCRRPLPERRSAVAYAYVSLSRPLSERRSAVAIHNVVNGPPPIAFPAVAFGLFFNLSFCLI